MKTFWKTLNPNRDIEWEPYHDLLCEVGEAIYTGELRRVVVMVPPGTTKTTIFSVCLPAWIWANDPTVRMLVAATDDSNAMRDSLSTRQLVESELYRKAYRTDHVGELQWALAEDQNAKGHYNTTRNGARIALSTNGRVTGKKGDILIVDDPNDARTVHSNAECERVIRWFDEAFFNRVNDFRTSRHLVIGQRTGIGDLQGHLIEQGGWTLIRLPEQFSVTDRCDVRVGKRVIRDNRTDEGEYLRPKRFGDTERDEAIRVMGSLAYAAQHEQRPENRAGRMFDRSKVRIVKAAPVGTVAVRFWDTAASVKDTACMTSGVLIGRTPEGRYIIIDVERGRFAPSDRNNLMRQTCSIDFRRPGIAVKRTYWEAGASDAGLERDEYLLKFLAGYPVEAVRAKGDKSQRAEPLSAQWNAGNVDVVEADWNHDYLDVMNRFPGRGLKDDADASSSGFNKLCEFEAGSDWLTAEEDDTVVGQLPKGTFRPRGQRRSEDDD